MKKILALIILGIGSWGLMTWAELQQHPTMFYIGLTIAGILGLGFLVWAFKHIAKFIGWSLSSVIYLVLAIATLTTLGFYNILPAGIGVVSSTILGVILTIMGIRRLASKAQTNLFWSDVFAWLTGYRLRNLIQNEELSTIVKVKEDKSDKETILGALHSLGYKKAESEEATDCVIAEHLNDNVKDKVKYALEYLNSKKIVGDE
jgi:hypothetical protein